MIKTQDHLTANGLEQIRLIKSGMNKGRLSDDSGKAELLMEPGGQTEAAGTADDNHPG
jgi:hypothetical protein